MKDIVVFDLDGTIADLSHRIYLITEGRKDWDIFYKRCIFDTPIDWVIQIMNILKDKYDIFIITGRSEAVRDRTLNWLNSYKVPFNELRMRKEGDKREDMYVKPELTIDIRYRIKFIVEDRNSVVERWRHLGFNVLQCANGDF